MLPKYWKGKILLKLCKCFDVCENRNMPTSVIIKIENVENNTWKMKKIFIKNVICSFRGEWLTILKRSLDFLLSFKLV